MRRIRRLSWAAVAAALLLALGLVPQDALAQDTVRHGIQRGALGALRVAMADIEAKHKLKYEYKDFNDSTAALLALEQGEVDVANTTLQHLVRAMDEGIPVVWVAGWGGGYNVLVAGANLGAKKGEWKGLAELAKKRKAEGKPLKVGVPTGSMQHLKLSVALKGAGIDPDKDVAVVNVPFPTHPRAIEGGEVDMAMTLAVFGALSINSGKGVLFDHIFDKEAGKQEIGFIVRRDAIEKRADYVQRIVASHYEAMSGFVADVPKQIQLELKILKLPEPVIAMVQRDFLRLDYRTNLPDIALMARQMHAVGWAKKDQSAAIPSYVNLTFLEKASGQKATDLGKW
jgi:ABC-type nitrate/sulfonate/bicarbonate transport system substrate-binding protein